VKSVLCTIPLIPDPPGGLLRIEVFINGDAWKCEGYFTIGHCQKYQPFIASNSSHRLYASASAFSTTSSLALNSETLAPLFR